MGKLLAVVLVLGLMALLFWLDSRRASKCGPDQSAVREQRFGHRW